MSIQHMDLYLGIFLNNNNNNNRGKTAYLLKKLSISKQKKDNDDYDS